MPTKGKTPRLLEALCSEVTLFPPSTMERYTSWQDAVLVICLSASCAMIPSASRDQYLTARDARTQYFYADYARGFVSYLTLSDKHKIPKVLGNTQFMTQGKITVLTMSPDGMM